MKTENGVEYPAAAYAFVPNAEEPSAWKIRLWESPDKKATVAQLGRAALALSAADVPADEAGKVKARIRAEYSKLGVEGDDVPESVRLSAAEFLGLVRIRLSAAEGEAPVRIPIAMIGTFYKGKKKFSISRTDVAHMAAAFRKRGTDVVLDYEHASDMPEVAQGGPVPAAGWITAVDDKPDSDGVVYGTVKLTDKARAMIAADEYRFVSPLIAWGARDRDTGEQDPGLTLISAALTNTPVLDQMPAIRLSATKGDEETVKEKVMCSEHPKTAMLCPQCDADEIKKMSASAAGAVTVIRLSDVGRDGEGRISLSRVAAGTMIDIDVIRAMESERIALSEVQSALTAGKITPAQKPFYEKMALSDIESFRALEKTLGKAVDTSERGHGGQGDGTGSELEQVSLRLSSKTAAKMKETGKSHHEAMKMVLAEDRELGRTYTRLMRAASRAEGGE